MQPQNIPLKEEIVEQLVEVASQRKAQLVHAPSAMKELYTFAYARACEEYFGNYFIRQGTSKEKFIELKSTGKLYCPPGGKHSWEANLNWLLGRFQNGSQFVIMSIVCEESKLRSSGLIGSGFFREIAACYKQGYRFVQVGNEMVLRHPNVQDLRNLRIDDIRMSDWEVDDMFEKAVVDFNRISRITTTPGMVRSKFMNEQQADYLLKKLIATGVDKLCTRVIPTVGVDNFYYVEVRSTNIADLRVAEKILDLLLDRTSKLKIEVKGSHFAPVEFDAQEFEHMTISRDVYSGLMLTRFNFERRDKKAKGAVQENKNQNKSTDTSFSSAIQMSNISGPPKPKIIITPGEVKSATMTQQVAERLNQELVKGGINSNLITTTFERDNPNSYQIIVQSNVQDHINIVKDMMQKMSIGIVSSSDVVRKEEHQSLRF